MNNQTNSVNYNPEHIPWVSTVDTGSNTTDVSLVLLKTTLHRQMENIGTLDGKLGSANYSYWVKDIQLKNNTAFIDYFPNDKIISVRLEYTDKGSKDWTALTREWHCDLETNTIRISWVDHCAKDDTEGIGGMKSIPEYTITEPSEVFGKLQQISNVLKSLIDKQAREEEREDEMKFRI